MKNLDVERVVLTQAVYIHGKHHIGVVGVEDGFSAEELASFIGNGIGVWENQIALDRAQAKSVEQKLTDGIEELKKALSAKNEMIKGLEEVIDNQKTKIAELENAKSKTK